MNQGDLSDRRESKRGRSQSVRSSEEMSVMDMERRERRKMEGVTERPAKTKPVQVPPCQKGPRAKQTGEIQARWAWVEAEVWTERMLTALGMSTLIKVNHQSESRMREIRPYGSEGGGAG